MVNKNTESELWQLIEKRVMPNADTKSIDENIWEIFGQEVCIMFTDLSGFSRMVDKFGIIHFLQTIYESKKISFPIIQKYNGNVLKVEGDSFMVIFDNPENALEASININRELKEYNKNRPDEEKILICIGLGYGKVLKISDHDIYGAEVNAASKLGEDTAKAWEILLTEKFKEKLEENGITDNISFEAISVKPPGAEKAFKLIYNL